MIKTTNSHRFILEPYTGPRSRGTCPNCGASHEFSRYVDTENGNAYLDDRAGKCNRTNNCDYHYTPKQHFADNGFPGDFKKSPFKSRKARTAAALSRVFSVGATPNPSPEQKNASESEQRETQSKLERLQSQMKQYQAAFENSPAQEYLISRGITAETAEAFICGYAAEWKHWTEKDGNWELIGNDRRVVFPITDNEGSLIAIHGRAIDETFIGTPKKTSGKRKQGLFQTPNAFAADVLFLVEGPADAMALHQCGFSAVASVATSIPDWLPNAVAFNKIMVALDADNTGDEAAEKHISELRMHGARAARLRPPVGKDWSDFLEKSGGDALRDFVERQTAEAFPDYQPLSQPEAVPEDFVIEDVFSTGNTSGQRVIDYLFAAAAKYGDDFLLTTPTIYAHETERALVTGVIKHSKGELTDAALKMLTEQFVEAHLRVNSASLTWTPNNVPLFHLTLKSDGKWLENETCNQIQSWVLREFWLRQTPEAEISVMNL
jgi:phage/plasmid primase-like uncharacterized protein